MPKLAEVDPNILILVVDDLPVVRRILKNGLSQLGFRNIVEASNGFEALEKLKVVEFKLVIADWNMPNMSGIDLLKTMRSDESLKAIPFLMCSSIARQEQVSQALEAGVSNYLVKPFTTEMLADKLESIFDNQEA